MAREAARFWIMNSAAQLAMPSEGKVPFSTLSLEAFIDLMRHQGDKDYAEDLHERYCLWERTDDIMEDAVPTELGG